MKTTAGNHVLVKLDEENNFVITKSGIKLYIDNTYEPEKHITVTGTVEGLPSVLNTNELPWVTKNELQIGDKVVIYYMAVMNALAKERKKYIKEGNNIWVFIKYSNIYLAVRNNKIIPINGYILAEPVQDISFEMLKKRYEKSGLTLVKLTEKSMINGVFAKIKYIGSPNQAYKNQLLSDDGVNIQENDLVILKKIRDIPVEYEYHAKLDNGKKYYKFQRHDIAAIINQKL